MKYCRIVTTWCRFWSSICLCRYFSESAKRWVEQKGGWWQEERKITYDMAQNHMWWFHIKEGFKGANVQSDEVEEEREDMLFWSSTKIRCPRDSQGQPEWLVWRLNVVVFYAMDLFLLNYFGSFFMYFLYVVRIMLDIMVL